VRVLCHAHLWPPDHNAGAELYAQTVLRDLQARGHECRASVRQSSVGEYLGIQVDDHTQLDRLWDWCDVAITHLDETKTAMSHARRTGKPLVHLVHNDAQLRYHRVTPRDAALVVFNSRWIADRFKAWRGAQITVPPPVLADDYRVPSPGKCITLINVSKQKGSDVFYELAERLPDREFLGVLGAYHSQVVWKRQNVRIIPNGPDARSVYAQTRVLLMPSGYESWGRTGIEAAVSGIPTIASPTVGLRESLGRSGIWADRRDVDCWVQLLRCLEKPSEYAHHSRLAKARAAQLSPMRDLERLARAIEQAASPRHPARVVA
jgi:glycosyltransferase involved in cell wall biosynthesis